jgi:YfiH family protein
MPDSLNWIRPDWPAPDNVHAVSTTRTGGASLAAYSSLNLGAHVGDDPQAVLKNRAILKDTLRLPSEPLWLEQVHGNEALGPTDGSCADARVVGHGQVAVVMTADCLPVLFTDRAGNQVAAAHAGWRGLEAGILENTVHKMNAEPQDIMAWLGPAIGPDVFEVGAEVREAFISHDQQAADAFKPSPSGRWLADLYALARLRLHKAGLTEIYGGGLCTFSDSERFYSFRRDRDTGRMASLIWIE